MAQQTKRPTKHEELSLMPSICVIKLLVQPHASKTTKLMEPKAGQASSDS